MCSLQELYHCFFCLFFSHDELLTGICADRCATILITNHITIKECFSILVLDAQCAPSPLILGRCPVHVGDADPVVVLIMKHTPLRVVTWRLPSTQTVRDLFDVVHFRQVDLTEGFVSPRLPPPGLSVDIAVKVLPNSHIQITIWKKQSRSFGPLWVVEAAGKVQTWRTCKLDYGQLPPSNLTSMRIDAAPPTYIFWRGK